MPPSKCGGMEITMKHKTALITGSSRGIGKAIALSLASEGYDVVLTCLNQYNRLLDVKQQAESMGVKALAIQCDIGDFTQVSRLFETIKDTFGGIDLLVNNAGISRIGLLSDLSVEEWHKVMNTNLNSIFYCSKLALPYMIHKKKGRIINISSVWGEVGASCEVAYSVSKGGVNSFTKALAKELAPSNIQVNAISCGAIDTEMNAFLEEEDRLALTDEIPASRFGDVQEVAQLVCTLATSPTYLTGQIIRLDGGWI